MLGARLIAYRRCHGLHQRLVEAGGHPDRLREDGCHPGSGDPVQAFVPPGVGGHIQPRDRRRLVQCLGDLLAPGHLRDQDIDPLIDRQRRVKVALVHSSRSHKAFLPSSDGSSSSSPSPAGGADEDDGYHGDDEECQNAGEESHGSRIAHPTPPQVCQCRAMVRQHHSRWPRRWRWLSPLAERVGTGSGSRRVVSVRRLLALGGLGRYARMRES